MDNFSALHAVFRTAVGDIRGSTTGRIQP